jgi:hypothetical protein
VVIVEEATETLAYFNLLFENSVLFDQVGDRARLLMPYPTSKRGQQEL